MRDIHLIHVLHHSAADLSAVHLKHQPALPLATSSHSFISLQPNAALNTTGTRGRPK